MAVSSLSSSNFIKRPLNKPDEEQKKPLKSIFSASSPTLAPQPKYPNHPLSASASPPPEDRSLKLAPQLFASAMNFSNEPSPAASPFSSFYPSDSEEGKAELLPKDSPVQGGIIIRSSGSINITNAKSVARTSNKIKSNKISFNTGAVLKPSHDKTSEFEGYNFETPEAEEGLFFSDLRPPHQRSKCPSLEDISPFRLDQENSEENESEKL